MQAGAAFIVKRGDGAAQLGDGLGHVVLLLRESFDPRLRFAEFFVGAQIHRAGGVALGLEPLEAALDFVDGRGGQRAGGE